MLRLKGNAFMAITPSTFNDFLLRYALTLRIMLVNLRRKMDLSAGRSTHMKNMSRLPNDTMIMRPPYADAGNAAPPFTREELGFAWPNDWTHQTKCRRVLEGATATGQPRRDSPVVGHKVQHFTSGRLPLPAARILSGKLDRRLGRSALKADPTQRCCFIEVGTGGRLAGA